jgi:hypothetical protein
VWVVVKVWEMRACVIVVTKFEDPARRSLGGRMERDAREKRGIGMEEIAREIFPLVGWVVVSGDE